MVTRNNLHIGKVMLWLIKSVSLCTCWRHISLVVSTLHVRSELMVGVLLSAVLLVA